MKFAWNRRGFGRSYGKSCREALYRQITGFFFRTTTFLVLFLSLTCNAVWVQLTSGLYKAYGQQFIDSDFFLSLIGSISSIFNAGSRVFWGAIADTVILLWSRRKIRATPPRVGSRWVLATKQLNSKEIPKTCFLKILTANT